MKPKDFLPDNILSLLLKITSLAMCLVCLIVFVMADALAYVLLGGAGFAVFFILGVTGSKLWTK